jgi:transketolase
MYSLSTDKPLFLIANTIKGKGIELMENNPEWHHKSPNEIEFQQIIKELL